ncbi:HAD family phosphatase [Fulvivirgaceae bacterium PWU4]|uniref:HAD family phosphatase n=1 Tax=Chryseosolibacter histidini TaxID=2782349 RepID=A0AAP2DNZ4_9BACT|nr:HAD family phosphatase [Chryseosolibacter histidini]MBT1698352.1 HAD family phosphatase [Chryseosolibacter histidini]
MALAVKNLIFDLGGVILDLSVDHTLQAFSDLSGIPRQKVQEIFISSPGFNTYEKGGMDDDAFRQYLKQIYAVNVTDGEIDSCWNAMLRGLPAVKLSLLLSLKKKYNVYLLSNTNDIHLSYINQVMLPEVSKESSLDVYFHKAYYSHRMLMRKPDAEIFERVLDENNLDPAETLFLDDNASNVTGAQSVGIKTVHVTTPDLILDYFHEQKD